MLALLAVLAFGYFAYSARPKREPPSWQEHDAEVKRLDAELRELAPEIKAHQGSGACETDEDCKVVGLGAKSCGGFKDFLIYSTTDADEPALLDLVSRFNAKMKKMDDLSLKVYSCGEKPVRARCANKRCAPVGQN